ncbi:hypothetical protein [Candidatus Palauibacter sp.]|uniref:hypothetical protein n=1 Tax=Candidatus Palauibacter sp. TaxID=3101350 RepID=UPI003B5C28D0
MPGTARASRRVPNALLSTTIAGLTLIAPAGAQERPGDTGGITTRETLPSGVERVTNVVPDDPSPTWTLVEELRVGSFDGDGHDVFGELRGLVVLPDGGFAVLDSQAQEVRVFAADGSHRATYGGEGEGPGELRDAHGLMLDPRGRIWVTDPANDRMSVFDPDNGFVESFRYHFSFYSYIWQGTMTAAGRIVRPTRSRQGFEVYDLNMELVESISPPSDPGRGITPEEALQRRGRGTPSGFAWQSRDGRRQGFMSVPFYPRGVRYYDREGMAWAGDHEADPPGYRMRRQHLTGDTTLIVVARKPHVPVTREDRDAAIEGIRERLRERGADTDRDWSKIPDVKPAIANLFTSVEGNIWVRTPPANASSAEATWDLFSSDGAYVGRVTSPELSPLPFLPPVVQGDEFWAVATDAFDVQYVVRARITPSG